MGRGEVGADVLCENLAVREGFEPSVPFWGYGALAKRCFRPLSHLTNQVRAQYEVDEGIVKRPQAL